MIMTMMIIMMMMVMMIIVIIVVIIIIIVIIAIIVIIVIIVIMIIIITIIIIMTFKADVFHAFNHYQTTALICNNNKVQNINDIVNCLFKRIIPDLFTHLDRYLTMHLVECPTDTNTFSV